MYLMSDLQNQTTFNFSTAQRRETYVFGITSDPDRVKVEQQLQSDSECFFLIHPSLQRVTLMYANISNTKVT